MENVEDPDSIVWQDQPIYFYVKVKDNEVFTQLDTLIGKVVWSNYSYAGTNRIIKHIRVKGTNGRMYYSKYTQPTSLICLKRCSEKQEARIAHKPKPFRFGRKHDAIQYRTTKISKSRSCS